MHEKGQGTKFDYKKAKELYLKADEYGHEIARLRYDALEGDIKNPTMGAGIKFNQYGIDFGYTAGKSGHPRANTMYFSLSMGLSKDA